jgi:Tol biopolymer transport system component
VCVLFLCAMFRGRWAIVSAVLVATIAVSLAAATTAPRAATSPGWIVFSAFPSGTAALQLQLYRVHPNGEGLRQLTKGTLPAVAPSLARNGTRIAFTRLGSGIFTVGLNGSGLRRLTSNARDTYPVYSPDGSRIAFNRIVGEQWRLFTMSASGRDQRRVGNAPPAGRPSWTSDGKSILVPSGGDLVKVDPKTGHVQKYYGLAIDPQVGQTATVSPNGLKVAYVGPRISTGPPDCGDGRCAQFGLYLANVPRPHRPRRIVNDTGAAGWSPDSKTLVFVSKGALTLRNVASGTQTLISTGDHLATGDAPPAWG